MKQKDGKVDLDKMEDKEEKVLDIYTNKYDKSFYPDPLELEFGFTEEFSNGMKISDLKWYERTPKHHYGLAKDGKVYGISFRGELVHFPDQTIDLSWFVSMMLEVRHEKAIGEARAKLLDAGINEDLLHNKPLELLLQTIKELNKQDNCRNRENS